MNHFAGSSLPHWRKSPNWSSSESRPTEGEAVQKAEQLKPDWVFLDIGLPSLNGIDAARQIRKLVPESKIIFVTQESSADVAQAAFDLGAAAYVVKSSAGGELLLAVEAVLRGRRFISSRVAGFVLTEVV